MTTLGWIAIALMAVTALPLLGIVIWSVMLGTPPDMGIGPDEGMDDRQGGGE